MHSPRKSPIILKCVRLIKESFAAKGPKLRKADIPFNAIRIVVQVTEVLPLDFRTECRIDVYHESDPRGDFVASFSYEIHSVVEEEKFRKALGEFARIGAAYNALIFARARIADLTSSAFGKAARLPLLDVRNLEAEIVAVPSAELKTISPESDVQPATNGE